MAHIDCYFAPISPFTFLAGNRMEAVADRHGATVTYKPLDIMALFARTGGTPVPQRHPSRIEYRAQALQRLAGKTGMPFNLKPAFWPTNAAPSSYAIIAAQKAGDGDLPGLVQGILRACFAEERDIAEDAVIKDCLAGAGFDPALAERGLLDGAETYAANLEEAVSAGVFGAPFYIVDGTERFWGQDSIEDLDRFLAGQP
ncbi:2-hydroxychromene-2-carboxylate isomerase [Pseudoponticoccus marisrubri]|uniref:2-hydroxychromene-2-carboxylate isomerase n=1 Tax=Pseudoponticoccus marisrubri TaxID=1685382 RepID=A0A0W7WGZ0_9RHOB|nr:2-hydroxychromene-2-carboxylate isomerase [Pseudoponticoccus marisrubri]KUF09735.1 2-hydroxychromene-2-carboxylate isomerase [Pseudoponticoccus marisrubri]